MSISGKEVTLMTDETVEANQSHSERRRYRRHPALELKAEVNIKKGFFGQRIEVAACDYSKRGMAIETEYSFKPEQPITLSIILKMTTGDMRIDKVEGIVKNIMTSHPKPRYGIEFDYDANRHMKALETKSQLGRIEGILERSETLRLKTEGQ